MLFHRFLHPALTSRCPLLSWECPVCLYLTLRGFLWMQALFRMQLVKISLYVLVAHHTKHILIMHKFYSRCFPISHSFSSFSAPCTLQKSFSARAVSRSHQRAEHILKNMQQEEEKRRLGREASIITAIPIAQEACYEPTCSPPPEQEEEGVSFLCCIS